MTGASLFRHAEGSAQSGADFVAVRAAARSLAMAVEAGGSGEEERLPTVAAKFEKRLAGWLEANGGGAGQLAGPQTPRAKRRTLFSACDELRGELQLLGVKVEDR